MPPCQQLPRRWGAQTPPPPWAPALTSAFLLGSLPATTETERAMGFAAEALLGRRNRGGGRPVRLRSMHSGGPEGPLTAREPFMMDEWALSRQEMQ